MPSRYGCSQKETGTYLCHHTENPIAIDGRLEKPVWKKAPKSPRFVDLVNGSPGYWDTRMAALWDEERLYIAFWIEEPRVRARLTERDDPVYTENDIEIFIDGDDCYYEFQINARGTIYEVFYIWQNAYRRGSRFDRPEFDLISRDVDVLGGFQDSLRWQRHPRGKRWAFMDWDFPGLESAVQVQGTLNDDSDTDRGWTVELAFPWEGMTSLVEKRSLPPAEGDVWKMDFSRFETLDPNGIPLAHHPGWAFNPHGVYDSHIPECFTRVRFTRKPLCPSPL